MRYRDSLKFTKESGDEGNTKRLIPVFNGPDETVHRNEYHFDHPTPFYYDQTMYPPVGPEQSKPEPNHFVISGKRQ